MVAHGTKAMSPTVIHAAAFDRDGSGGGGRGRDWGRSDSGSSSFGGRRRGDGSAVRAMETSVASGEATNAFFVTELKLAVHSSTVRRRNFSVAVTNMPFFSIMARVRVMIMVTSGMGTCPRVTMRWMLEILDQRSLMGSSKFHGSDNAERLRSSSSGVMVQYSARR